MYARASRERIDLAGKGRAHGGKNDGRNARIGDLGGPAPDAQVLQADQYGVGLLRPKRIGESLAIIGAVMWRTVGTSPALDRMWSSAILHLIKVTTPFFLLIKTSWPLP